MFLLVQLLKKKALACTVVIEKFNLQEHYLSKEHKGDGSILSAGKGR